MYSLRHQRTLERREQNTAMLAPYLPLSPMARALTERWEVRRAWLVKSMFDEKVCTRVCVRECACLSVSLCVCACVCLRVHMCVGIRTRPCLPRAHGAMRGAPRVAGHEHVRREGAYKCECCMSVCVCCVYVARRCRSARAHTTDSRADHALAALVLRNCTYSARAGTFFVTATPALPPFETPTSNPICYERMSTVCGHPARAGASCDMQCGGGAASGRGHGRHCEGGDCPQYPPLFFEDSPLPQCTHFYSLRRPCSGRSFSRLAAWWWDCIRTRPRTPS